jgi:pimeloyl-ACP methyl ester carboxylesterase
MEWTSCFVDNGNVKIHYLDSDMTALSTQVPLLICPGLSETAEEYIDLMEYLHPRRCVVLSFRGRGQSSTPNEGYDLKHHVSDVEAVVHAAGLNRFHLYSYSRGVSYALGYMEKLPQAVCSLIVQDYPPMHKEMDANWAEDYILNYLVIFNRQRNIRPEAVRGIQNESVQKNFMFKTNKKLLALRGMLEGSLLDAEGIKAYQLMNLNLTSFSFEKSGHDIRNTEKDLLYRTINRFLMS